MKNFFAYILTLTFLLTAQPHFFAQTIKLAGAKSHANTYRLGDLSPEPKISEQNLEIFDSGKDDCENCDEKDPKCVTKCIPAGTQIDLELDDALDLDALSEKDVIRFRVATAILVDKITVIPTSAYALGVVKKYLPAVDSKPAEIIIEAQTLHTGTGQLPINLKGSQQVIRTLERLYNSSKSTRASIEHEVRICIPCCR